MNLQFLKTILLIGLFTINIGSLKAQFDVPEKLDGLGLIAQLSYAKSVTEQYATAIINSQYYVDSNKRIVKLAYIKVKIAYDQIINQLIVDIKSKNCLGTYRKLDKSLKDNNERTSRKYLENLKVANDKLESFKDIVKSITPKSEKEVLALEIPLLEPAIEIAELALEIKEKKIDAVCEILLELRLVNLDEKKEEEKDKD